VAAARDGGSTVTSGVRAGIRGTGGGGARGALRATTRLAVEAADGAQRIRWAHAWPVVLRETGRRRVHLVHAAGGPLGGDDLGLDVEVGAGAAVAVHSAGATLVQPGAGAAAGVPARWAVTARVGGGGRLDWAPEATVVADGAALESTLRVALAAGAAATVREVVVLGRHGQRGGRYAGGLEVVVDGAALLAHTTLLDGADPALCGPAGTAGARAVGTLVCAGAVGPHCTGSGESADVRWAWAPLDGPGAVLVAVGTAAAVTAVLDAAGPAASPVAQARIPP
jgi:urease accessory protein